MAKLYNQIKKDLEAYFEKCTPKLKIDPDTGEPMLNKRGEHIYEEPPKMPTINGMTLACGFNSRWAFGNYLTDGEKNAREVRKYIPEDIIEKLATYEDEHDISLFEYGVRYVNYKRGRLKDTTEHDKYIFDLLDEANIDEEHYKSNLRFWLGAINFPKIKEMFEYYETLLTDRVEQKLFDRDGSRGAQFWLSAQKGWTEKTEVTNSNVLEVMLVDDEE